MVVTSLNRITTQYTKKNLLRIDANGLYSLSDATNDFPDIVHIFLFNPGKK